MGSFFSHLSVEDLGAYAKLVQDSLQIRRHADLFDWLQRDVQRFLPHDILLVAWGDFSLNLVHFDVVSPLPGLRTSEVEQKDLLPFLVGLFKRWLEIGRGAFQLAVTEDDLQFRPGETESKLEQAMADMSSALVQGIKDERGRHDCLYVLLSQQPTFPDSSPKAFEVMLPYIDAALRQVAHLPSQFPEAADAGERTADTQADNPQEPVDDRGLTAREREIIHWVRMGKTNADIGTILDISTFTVKNHLQRIFRKLNVINRAQAVSTFEKAHPRSDG